MGAMALKSAWEIALEKNETYEELSAITDELLEHVAMLEEGWAPSAPASFRTRSRSPGLPPTRSRPDRALRLDLAGPGQPYPFPRGAALWDPVRRFATDTCPGRRRGNRPAGGARHHRAG